MSKELIKHIKHIEQVAYPKPFQQMQHIQEWDDLEDYCESLKVHVISKEHFYIILAFQDSSEYIESVCEIVDLASISGINKTDVEYIITEFKKISINVRNIICDMRETSYKFIPIIESIGFKKVSICKYFDNDFGEDMNRVKFIKGRF